MIRRTYDPTKPYRFLMYGRMSDQRQNPSSPDQQFRTSLDGMARRGFPWHEVRRYRDDAVSGRYVSKRDGLQAMLRDIELKLVRADLIVVDTIERLGRADEIAEIRRKLKEDYGVLVVTGDSGFADPTGPTGKALGMIEAIRSTEDGRVKAHNVTRGKVDSVLKNRWPGGPPPFGFKLKQLIDASVNPGRPYCVLDPVPEEVALVLSLFRRADATGEGNTRLAQWWNACPDVPAKYKPMSAYTIGYILDNAIYVGTMVWGAHNTDVINDARVIEKNPDGPAVVKPDFCEPVVPVDLFGRVRVVRQARSDAYAARSKAAGDGKLIRPPAAGLTLKYPLAGLVRCGCCGGAMQPVASRHVEHRGEPGEKAYPYTHYRCPRGTDRACGNRRYVREDKLRPAVVDRLRAKLFPPPDRAGGVPDWFPEVCAMVQAEWAGRLAAEPDRAAADERECRDIEERLQGWQLSLGSPTLPAAVRDDIAALYDAGKARLAAVRGAAADRQAADRHLRAALNPRLVLDALHHLDEVLAAYNPTAANLELSKHVDRIDCFPDGRVVLRGTPLGVLGDGGTLLNRRAADPPTPVGDGAEGFEAVRPRLRSRRRVPTLTASDQPAANQTALLDPDRFAGLADHFFWRAEFVIAEDPCWSEANATAVAEQRLLDKTHAELAAHFGVTVPTIRKALKTAAKSDLRLTDLPRKMPRVRWEEEHFREVAERRAAGWSVAQLASHFERSEPLIRNALRLAAEQGLAGHTNPEPPAESGSPFTAGEGNDAGADGSPMPGVK